MIQLVCHFTDETPGQDFATTARAPVALLAAQPTCLAIRLGRSTDDGPSWVLTAEFATVSDYRRALAPFDVRTLVVPFLSTADQASSGVYEVLLRGVAGETVEIEGIVAH